jgi:cbb3-type cytochrome oxidase subunit 3
MSFDNWLTIALFLVPSFVTVVVWLVRLEGKIKLNEKATTILEEKARTHEDTKLEVVRVQEQIKQLKDLLERYLKEVHDGR